MVTLEDGYSSDEDDDFIPSLSRRVEDALSACPTMEVRCNTRMSERGGPSFGHAHRESLRDCRRVPP